MKSALAIAVAGLLSGLFAEDGGGSAGFYLGAGAADHDFDDLELDLTGPTFFVGARYDFDLGGRVDVQPTLGFSFEHHYERTDASDEVVDVAVFPFPGTPLFTINSFERELEVEGHVTILRFHPGVTFRIEPEFEIDARAGVGGYYSFMDFEATRRNGIVFLNFGGSSFVLPTGSGSESYDGDSYGLAFSLESTFAYRPSDRFHLGLTPGLRGRIGRVETVDVDFAQFQTLDGNARSLVFTVAAEFGFSW